MYNVTLKTELKEILTNKADLSITKGSVSGSSIEVFNTKTNSDMGSYTYYTRVANRDADFDELKTILNNG